MLRGAPPSATSIGISACRTTSPTSATAASARTISIKPGSEDLVDALVAWGDTASIRARLRGLLDGGADHVAIVPLTADGLMADAATMEALAPPW